MCDKPIVIEIFNPDGTVKSYHGVEAVIHYLSTQNKELRGVLKFYADERNYNHFEHPAMRPKILKDKGKLARERLLEYGR